jgi:DNA-binding MarR family transcriptional regulator
MEERGLIERRRSIVDKRKVEVFLTAGFLGVALERMKKNFIAHWKEQGITTSIVEPAKGR